MEVEEDAAWCIEDEYEEVSAKPLKRSRQGNRLKRQESLNEEVVDVCDEREEDDVEKQEEKYTAKSKTRRRKKKKMGPNSNTAKKTEQPKALEVLCTRR